MRADSIFSPYQRPFIREECREKRLARLHPRERIFLHCPQGDGERFARLFRGVWRRLSLGVRRAMMRHWRNPACQCFILNPLIRLDRDWEGRVAGRGLGGDKAVAKNRGHEIFFCTRIVHAYPDALVDDLIAHELAHVYQFSRGMRMAVGHGRAAAVWNGRELTAYEVEDDADSLMCQWGFEPYAMDEWDLENGVTGNIDPDRVSESTLRRLKREMKRAGR